MRVSEVMTQPPISCSRTTSIRNAARMLREHDVGFLLVVDELWNRTLMGVVTDRDLCLTGLGEEHSPVLTTVEDCMSTDVVTCTPNTDLVEVVGLMTLHQIRRMPVVDRKMSVIGVVGIHDLIAHKAISEGDLSLLLRHILEPRQTYPKAA
jgi:CBS-domain-containing membrane protein